MPTNISVDTVRKSLPKLAQLFQAGDVAGYTNGRVNAREAKDLSSKVDLGDAVEKVQRYAQKRYGTSSPSLKQLNQALGEAMRMIAKGDENKGGMLSPAEQQKLAMTWRSIVEFARASKGKSVESILGG
jgi:hypothetical protein